MPFPDGPISKQSDNTVFRTPINENQQNHIRSAPLAVITPEQMGGESNDDSFIRNGGIDTVSTP